MDKDELYQFMKKAHDRIRWAGLSPDPDYVQLCHEGVESNARRIEKVLNNISDLKRRYDFVIMHKDVFFQKANEESWNKAHDLQLTMHEVMSHFCECLDIQSNFLLMNKNALICQSDAEKTLIYRHIQVDLVRAFQRLHFIDEYIRKNDGAFSVEMQRRECKKQKSVLNKKYGIEKGSIHDDRNKTAAHWDEEIGYIDLYEKSKTVSYDQIFEICTDMFDLTQSYSHCLHEAIKNYMKKVKMFKKQSDKTID